MATEIMGTAALVAYLVLAVLAVVQAFLVGMQTWEHRRFARNRFFCLNRSQPRGRAMVFAPCKGLDVGLEENLRRLFHQDYENYEITFVVQSVDDPACELIGQLRAENPDVPSYLVVAGHAEASGQKVHNLRVATSNLDERIDYLVFVDSDARPSLHWLRALLGSLSGKDPSRVGAVTGYRWFVPRERNLFSLLIAGINCRIAMLFGSRARYPVWGGSWAIRRDLFEEIGLPQAWSGTLSDDLVASNLLHQHERPVRFDPPAMVASPLKGTSIQLFSFLRRQYVIGRFYIPGWWGLGLLIVLAPNMAWAATVAMLAWALAVGSPLVWIPLIAGGLHYGLCVATAIIRQSLVGLYFPDLEDALKPARRLDIWAGPLVGLANMLGMLASVVGNQISWRGITYRLLPGGRVQIVKTDQPSLPPALPLPATDDALLPERSRPADLEQVA
ncbi:MAG: glycosyltransferase [Pirellulales bacterium]|nr:glycosyltransferase [Pirellulales bacterium]